MIRTSRWRAVRRRSRHRRRRRRTVCCRLACRDHHIRHCTSQFPVGCGGRCHGGWERRAQVGLAGYSTAGVPRSRACCMQCSPNGLKQEQENSTGTLRPCSTRLVRTRWGKPGVQPLGVGRRLAGRRRLLNSIGSVPWMGPARGWIKSVVEPARGRLFAGLFQVGKPANQAAAFHQFDGRVTDEVQGGFQVDGEVVEDGGGAGDDLPATQD